MWLPYKMFMTSALEIVDTAKQSYGGNLDMAIASVDKNSDAAANFRLLRSRIRRPAEPPEAEADGQDRDDESPPLKDETPPPGA